MINTDVKEKKMFVSIVAYEFFDRVELDRCRRPPDGMFRESCENGIVWATLINSDFIDTMTRLALSMPTYADKVIFFTSDDYHKVDKFEWEKASQPYIENDLVYVSPYDYVDDSVDDKYAEYLVSYDSIKLCDEFFDGFVVSNLVAKNFSINNIDASTRYYMATVSGLKDIFKKLIEFYVDVVDQQLNALVDIGLAYKNDKGIVVRNRQDFSSRSATLLIAIIMPFIINIKCNAYCRTKTAFPFQLWYKYCVKYLSAYVILLYNVQDVFLDENSTRKDFDRYREKIFDFYDVSSNNRYDVINARLNRFPRNDKCPCGSGKKWKQCHGKNYC